jgi:hypothetical protein
VAGIAFKLLRAEHRWFLDGSRPSAAEAATWQCRPSLCDRRGLGCDQVCAI